MEYLVRFICSPRKWRFFKQPMNLVDFFAIIPFMLDLVIGGLQVWPKSKSIDINMMISVRTLRSWARRVRLSGW